MCRIIPLETLPKTFLFGQVIGGFIDIQGRLRVALLGSDITHVPEGITLKTELLDPSGSSQVLKFVGQCLFDVSKDKPGCQSQLWHLQISLLGGLLLAPKDGNKNEFCRIKLFRLTDHGVWFEGCLKCDLTMQ